jgi:PAS domain S-box-containing protein/putative nucleotidyltransferase with HDIG domain
MWPGTGERNQGAEAMRDTDQPDRPGSEPAMGPLASSGAHVADDLSFSDLFDLEKIQAIQDAFSAATGVASLVTTPDGTPITRPSNFCRLCRDIIRGTEKGAANCACSDTVIGASDPSGPVVQPCLSGGLWDAGASINVGGVHIANWLVGQVRNEAQDETAMLAYAEEIGADPNEFEAALAEVPRMARERFDSIARALFLIANELSAQAYQNLQYGRLLGESRRSEKAMRESEALLAAILDAAPQSIFVKDPSGSYVRGNRAFADVAGFTDPAQVIGRADSDMPWSADAEAFRDDDSEVMRLRRPKRHIIEQVRAGNGAVLWVDTTKVPLVDESGTPYAVLGVFDDITERRRLEEVAGRIERNLNEAERMGHTGSWDYDVATDKATWSENMFRLFDVDPSTPAGLVFQFFVDNLVHPDDRANVRAVFQDALAGVRPYDLEYRVVLRDGSIRNIHAIAEVTRDQTGHAVAMVGRVEDTTERDLAESALRDSEERFHALFEQAPMGYQSLDEDGCFLEVNQAWLDLLGFSREEVLGKWFVDFLAPEFADAFRKRFPLFKERGSIHSEFQMIHKDGSRHAIAFEGRIGHNPDGTFRQTHCILADVTERQRAEIALHESEDRLRRAVKEAPIPMIIHVEGGEIVQLNDAWERISGYSLQDTPTMSDWAEQAYGPRAGTVQEDIDTLYGMSEPRDEGDVSIRTKSGEERVWHFRSAALGPVAGGRRAVISTAEDVTDRNLMDTELRRQKQDLQRALASVIEIARDIVEARDPYTAGHQRRVSEIAVKIAQELGMPDADIEDIRVASLLHDVGKVSVPSEILSKPGNVSALEYEILKGHAESGYQILAGAHMAHPLSELVHQHHERCDGSGYPHGLTAEQTLPGAKVIAVADVVEAMMSHRPYRPALGIEAALAEIEQGAGTRYDADAARACIAIFRDKGFEVS